MQGYYELDVTAGSMKTLYVLLDTRRVTDILQKNEKEAFLSRLDPEEGPNQSQNKNCTTCAECQYWSDCWLAFYTYHALPLDIVSAHEFMPRLKFSNEGPRLGMAFLFALPASLNIAAFCSLATGLPATLA